MKTAMYNRGVKVGYKERRMNVKELQGVISDVREVSPDELHKEHKNGFAGNKTIILWFPGCEQPLETDIIETYFDEADLTHKPILH